MASHFAAANQEQQASMARAQQEAEGLRLKMAPMDTEIEDLRRQLSAQQVR